MFLNEEFCASDIVGRCHLHKLWGQYLSRARAERGWSIADLASMTGLSHSQLQRIESGQNKFDVEIWEMLCEIFDFPQSDLENMVKIATVFKIIEIEEAFCENR